jgi:oligopeptidase B
MQKYLNIPGTHTAVFGRSAGGYIIGSTVARNPNGALFKVAYTEVPYVDVLRTASNPELPLTQYEYMEFGNPREVIADFEAILEIAPIESLGPHGAPGVFVLCRASENDTNVYAYESVKWIDALRGNGVVATAENKILFVTSEQGHVVNGMEQHFERAEDFLVLCEKMLAKK